MGVIFNKCCGCIELESGSLIIVYLNMFGHIAIILQLIHAMGAFGLVTGGEVSVQTIGDFMFASMVTMLVIGILFLAFNIVLLVGLHKNKRGHVLAYLIFALIFNVLYIILFFVNLGLHINDGYLIWQVVNIILGIYFLLVIGSYYQTMDDPANKPEIYNMA